MSTRLSKHTSQYKIYQQSGKGNYVTSFQIIEKQNYDIVLVEEFPCENKMQLHARERFHIEKNVCVNKMIPTRTDQEYYDEKKDEIIRKRIERYNSNPQKEKEYSANYYKQNIEARKEYVKKTKEHRAETFKAYYEKHKEEINERVKLRRQLKKQMNQVI